MVMLYFAIPEKDKRTLNMDLAFDNQVDLLLNVRSERCYSFMYGTNQQQVL